MRYKIMEVTVAELEYRGLTRKTTKDGRAVYTANFEDTYNNQPISIYVGANIDMFVKFSKGDIVSLVLDYNFTYKTLKILQILLTNPVPFE